MRIQAQLSSLTVFMLNYLNIMILLKVAVINQYYELQYYIIQTYSTSAMIDVQKKKIKTVQDYRHSIKLLKYHLKKERKTNDKLQYQAAKFKHRPHAAYDARNRVYQLSETVKIVSDRLKRMGLVLEDVFRMADNKYEGEITKQQFMKVISRIKTDLNDSVFAEMFYAIDTSLNGLISQDQFFQFSIAYGGCTDAKQIRKFQNKSKTRFNSLLLKKYNSVQNFLSHFKDPIPIEKLSNQLKSLGLNNNQCMILLKTFDPSHEGAASHKFFTSIMSQAKAKTQQQQQNQQFTKNVNDLCILFRDRKINPLIVYQEADVDGKEGVSPFQLEQAFKKTFSDQTMFQIKKWVAMINFNNDSEITKEQYLNSIRGFFTINQLDKFEQQNYKKHPQIMKKLGPMSTQSVQATLKKLAIQIEDRGLSKKQAFQFFDFNKSKDIDEKQMLEGLKMLSVNNGLIANVMASLMQVFDKDGSKTIQMNQWLRIMGEDVEMDNKQMKSDVDMDDFSDQDPKAKKDNVKNAKQNPENKKVNQTKKTTTPAKPQPQPAKKAQPLKQSTTSKKQQQKPNENKPPNQPVKKSDTMKTDTHKNQSTQKNNGQSLDKKQSLNKTGGIKKNESLVDDKKLKDSKKQAKKETPPAPLPNKKFAEDATPKPNKQKQKPKQQPKPVIKKTDSTVMPQKQQQHEPQEPNTDDVEQQIAVKYKKNKKKTLKLFEQFDKNGKNFVNLKNFNTAMKGIDKDLKDNDIKQIFMKYCVNGNQLKYVDWLEQIGQMYANEVEQQPQIQHQQEHKQQQVKQINKPKQQNTANNVAKPQKQKQQKPQPIKQQKKQERKAEQKLDKSQKLPQPPKKMQQTNKVKRGEESNKVPYKLFDYISDEENELKKMRDGMMQKAKQAASSGKLFQDKDFPAAYQSICKNPKADVKISNHKLLQWKHYSEIYSKPQLFKGGIEPNDIRQGSLGDCYFLSSLASLAEYNNLIERLFQYSDMKTGYFLIWLCIDGKWRLVQIDGYLPVMPNGTAPAFSHSVDGELWVALLEKAYAKSYGDYNNIVGGQPFQAIKDLTGGPGQQLNFDKYKMEEIWQKLLQADKNQYIMTAGTKVQKLQGKVQGHDQDTTKTGIVLGHAYSILELQQVSGQKILKLRNPWGEFQWSGDDWSDKGKKWTSQMKAKLKYEASENDGIFWISLPQFYANFMSCSINYIRPLFYYRSGTLKGIQQIMVTLPAKSFNDGYLMVSHKDHRHDGIPINTPYDGIYSLLGFIYKDGEVLKKYDEKKFYYEREGFVEFFNMGQFPEGAQVMMMVNLFKSTNVQIAYYGDKPVDFDIQRDCLKFIEKLAFMDENGPKTQTQSNALKIWQSSVQGFVFLCFKNILTDPLTIKVTIKDQKNLTLLPPFKAKQANVLKIKPGEISSLKLKITGNPYSYSYGIST